MHAKWLEHLTLIAALTALTSLTQAKAENCNTTGCKPKSFVGHTPSPLPQEQQPKEQKVEYEFNPKLNPEYVIFRLPNGGGKVASGTLDSAGNFVRDEKQEPWVPPHFKPVAINDPIGPVLPLYGTNQAITPQERVYEYRFGMLIPGLLGPTGDCLPLAGEMVISLEDYLTRYDPKNSRRIYNLPGRIVPKGEKEPAEPKK